ncbi:acetylxylan esterase [Methylobacter sp. S3L5C]|uniref:acetylxylan esterase n=1 Tax=Methylobacter sp. S3L5C TaxID=2839024 RepID=UPI001FAB8D92|nr:acetylxylan esterase [Methylobacter sp. S3L5C]UOA07932.1 acetylxylan esterase [Methylobacter sp. S3L5C]
MNTIEYDFDPTYGYSLDQLLEVKPPKEPKDFDSFWQQRYQKALTINPQPQTKIISEDSQGWRVFGISYISTDNFPVRGWLMVPTSGVIKRGFIVGHGYGGRDGPDYHLPFKDAALLFPCSRGLGLSAQPSISSEPCWHVLHNINQKDRYILGGCVEDVWLAVTAMLSLFPNLAGRLGYLGISFGGGIGALALAWESRISRGHLNVPSFGHHPLRLRLASNGSAHSVQQYYCTHKKQTLNVLRYYDAALAAKRITIPMHCACAKFDPCVAPPGQFAIYNALPEQKQLFILEAGHHNYSNQVQQEYELINQLDAFFAPLGED